MKVKGIILDELNLAEIRLAGFTKFRIDSGEMDYRDKLAFQEWEISKQDELEEFSLEYMQGQDDAKFFIFSDKKEVQNKIKSLFSKLTMVEVNSEDYPLDYNYANV